MPEEPRELAEIIRVAKLVSTKVTYPIRDLQSGVQALGKDAAIEYEGKSYTVSQLGDLLPEDYFPIESEEDLVMKLADLEMRHPERQEQFAPATMGEEQGAPEGEKPPPIPDVRPSSETGTAFIGQKR